MKIPTKEDFYLNSSNSEMDITYAINKYLGKNHKDIIQHIKTHSVFWFLEHISYIGVNAYLYYIIPVLSYVKNQSKYWDDDYDNFDGRPIDDEAPLAYDVLPKELTKKIQKYPVEMKKVIDNSILEFCLWAISNDDKFNKECFFRDNIKQDYIDLVDKIKDMDKRTKGINNNTFSS